MLESFAKVVKNSIKSDKMDKSEKQDKRGKKRIAVPGKRLSYQSNPGSWGSRLSISSETSGDGPRQFTEEEDVKESLAYGFFNQEQMHRIMQQSIKQIQKEVAELTGMTQVDSNLHHASVVDYYLDGLLWAKHKQHYTEQQVSVIVTLMHCMYENITIKKMRLVDCIHDFKKFFVNVGKPRGPEDYISGTGMEIFDVTQAKSIMRYFAETLFAHYKLFTFVFRKRPSQEVVCCSKKIEVSRGSHGVWPPPLTEAVRAEFYHEQVQTQAAPPAPTAEEADAAAAAGALHQGKHVQLPAPNDEARIAALLAKLSVEEIRQAFDDVLNEDLLGLKLEVLAKLRQKENDFIERINKLHIGKAKHVPE